MAALGRKLRVGVLLDAPKLSAWQSILLDRIRHGPHTELAVVVWDRPQGRSLNRRTGSQPERDGVLRRALAWPLTAAIRLLEAKIECEHDAYATASDTDALNGVFSVEADLADTDAIAQLAELEIAVWLDLGLQRDVPAIAGAAAYGLWCLQDAHGARADAAAFWPIRHAEPVTECAVEGVSPVGTRTLVAQAHPATNAYSLKLNRSARMWRMTSLVLRRLERLHQSGSLSSAQSAALIATDRPSRGGSPSPRDLAGYIASNVGRRMRACWSRNLQIEQWILLVKKGPGLALSPGEFSKIVPPPDRYWADPHVVRRDGRFYIFVEEYPLATAKGHISVIALNDDGTHEPSRPVLERPYHLSYPSVFEHEGEIYMVPESEANGTIDLYRCVDFPLGWEQVETLMDKVSAVDSTLVHHHGKWWLFANMVDLAGASFSEELFIFHSTTLIAGRWTPHRMNPVVSDARRARPAGPILRNDGQLYRPAQDCSRRYGYGVRLFEITHLSEDDYAEAEVARVEPTWDKGIVATHTLSYTPGLTVMDAVQPRFRSRGRSGPAQ